MSPTDAAGALAELAERFSLTIEQRSSLACLLDPLSGDDAPTSIRERSAIVRDHLADSLVALELPELSDPRCRSLVDLGSGAGLPALPLAICRPALRVVALESAGRKAAFIARAAEACGAPNVMVVARRAEEYGERDAFELVTARALAPLAVVAEYAAPLLRLGGTLVAWRGRRDPDGEATAARAAELLGLECGPILTVSPYPGVAHRHLHLLRKVRPTPERFPRRPGMARKRPLGP